MKRLFTFGCSFTEYPWPSWADLISVSFDYYENWGYRGIGNRGIAERIAEAHVKNKFNQDDTIIIQWSSHLRHDWYHSHSGPNGRMPGWKTSGSIFSPQNINVHTDEWINLFFDESAYIMHTFNNIVLVQNFLKSIGVSWYMTSIGDLRKIGTDIKIEEKYGESINGNTSIDTVGTQYPHLVPYIDVIWNDHSHHWLDPLHVFSMTCEEHSWWFNDETGSVWKEPHPSTTQYNKWIKKNLVNKVSVLPEEIDKIDKITSTVEKIKTESDGKILNFTKALQNSTLDYITWPNTLKGFKD